MNKCKSLSDSSSSDSEEDGIKIQQQPEPVFPNHYAKVNIAKTYTSTSESEEDYGKRMRQPNVTSLETMNNTNSKRKLSSDDTEDDNIEPSAKAMRDNFKTPTRYREIEFSGTGSESDDRSSSERSIPVQPNTLEKKAAGSTAQPTIYNGIARKIMEKMGYKSGTGLGKYSQGRTEIIEASKQRGRRGLGLKLKGLEPADVKWDFNKEQEAVDEGVSWMPSCLKDPPDMSQLRQWVNEGKKNLSIETETEFCDPDVLRTILAFKSIFDNLDPDEMRRARTRSNPFETIRGVIFLNRAAMKMANMDAGFDFMFTDPKDKEGVSMIGPQELLYFADICAGPGGFSEYVLWRKKWECKGFGFTLKRANDFKLEDFFSGPPETFEPYYGIDGVEGDGDIYLPENLREFRRFVLDNTDNKGVHFVMADGGFSVEGQENIQEILSKRLYLCQFLCALMILRTGGHFLCKLFDIFTPFSVGLIYLMHLAFEKVSIHKPNTSRPANSERYIICKWRKENTKDICDYMFEVNCRLGQLIAVTSESDVLEVVPIEVLKADKEFCDYIVDSNNVIGERQIIHLDKIRAFTQNTELHEGRQSDFRKQCLSAWKIPDKARSAPSRPDPSVRFKELMKGENLNYLDHTPESLIAGNLHKLKNIYDYKCVVSGEVRNSQAQAFFFSSGRSNIYRLDAKSSKWLKIEATLELPVDTLIYGELIPELKGEGRAQRKIMCLHIIDALFLGGRDVRSLHFEDRMCLARKLAKAVSKPSRSDYTPLKVKKIWSLDSIKEILSRLTMKNVKGYGGFPRMCFDMEDGRHFVPSGLLILKTVSDPWITAYSKSRRRVYYFNTKNQVSVFDRVPESGANFRLCFLKRMLWNWERGVQLIPGQKADEDSTIIHSEKLSTFVREYVTKLTGVEPED